TYTSFVTQGGKNVLTDPFLSTISFDLAHLAKSDWQVRTCCAKFEHLMPWSSEILASVSE
ncbi:MAG: hypothetical protein COX41_02475, partial [Candidatus Omnitrophica bacterium CG23_combo_of_CG06-09_8_20_14_all_41_10]